MENSNKVEYDITRTSPFTGVTRTLKFMLCPDDVQKYMNGGLIQACFPYLSVDEREFIVSGITADEWAAAFGG
ncbi:hypothetical protein [Nostoc phage NMeng1]|nr:hypothetical protein [Nostoc phage NMeng1]